MGRIQTARHDGLIRRLFSIKGGGSLMAESLGDAFPVLPLEGGPPELLKLAGWELGLAGQQTTSPVGQTLGMQLFNPADSGILVVVTRLEVSISTATIAFLGVTAVALATASVGRQRDTREGVLAQTAGTSRHGNNTTPPVGAMRLRVNANIGTVYEDSDALAVLAPGTGLTFVTVATNVVGNSAWLYRERSAEPSELNF